MLGFASHHGIAADVVGLQVMGYKLDKGRLFPVAMELRNLSVEDIEVVGEDIDDVKVLYADHEDINEQLTWPLQADWHSVFDRA
ncbi:MAG: hypothetical protein CM1200mP39_26180 [Dehalococcoidia bacterium]|nr:MAG: hypothetical protein CM1200mP39_26180 [Dehalococcoidia bacterium]